MAKRILVYGAGAVGGYLGAKLAHVGHGVTLVTREVAAAAIADRGLRVARPVPGGTSNLIHVQPRAVSSLRQAMLNEAYDAIILGMKSYDLDTAINELIAFCPQPPVLITIQNGIGLEEMLMAQFGTDRVVAGSITVPVSLEGHTKIVEEREDRGLALAATSKQVDARPWVQLFEDAGIKTARMKDYRALKWSKALTNMLGNGTAAILNRHPRVIYGHEGLFALEVEMLREALAVMKAQKIKVVDLPGAPLKRLIFGLKMPTSLLQPVLTRLIAEGRGNKLPSFQLDLNAGKAKNEIIYHNGAVAQAGRKLGIPTPVNEALTTILVRLARGKLDREQFSGNPKALLKAVAAYRRKVAEG